MDHVDQNMYIATATQRGVKEEALACAKMGLPVFPVNGVRNGACTCGSDHAGIEREIGKHPCGGLTFKNATTDISTINSWFARWPHMNFGVATGVPVGESGKMILVIDVDLYKEGADQALAEQEAKYGALPMTAEVLTGGGGRHLYYYARVGTKFSKNLGHSTIDIKGIGGYVIGPGSRHRSGKDYGWEGSSNPNEGQEIADLPEWVYEQFEKRDRPQPPNAASQVSIPVTDAELRSYRASLDQIPADGRADWLEVLMALKSRSDTAEMFALADQWSSKSPAYKGAEDVRRTWQSISAEGGITIKTLDRLASKYALAEVDVEKIAANLIAAHNAWPEVEPIGTDFVANHYPVDALPLLIRDAVIEVADITQAPVALVACSALSALSLAAQSLYDVKRDEGLIGPVSLFCMALAESGERKSTLDTHFMQPIRDFEDRAAEEAKPVISKFNADMLAWEAKCRGIQGKIEKAAGRDKSANAQQYERELQVLHEEKPVPPFVPRLIYSDTTPEALTSSLARNWPSGGVISSEGGIVLGGHGMKAENQMSNLATINELWDGKPVRVDRRTSESFTAYARLTVAVQVQPAAFEQFVKKSGTLARGTGFLARFLMAYPESTQGARFYQRAPKDWPRRNSFCARISELVSQCPQMNEGRLEPTVLSFTEEAMEAWISLYNEVEAQLGKGGNFRDIRDTASKIADNAARIAALFHAMEATGKVIQAPHVRGASEIARWHLVEAQRILGVAALTPDQLNALGLIEWLIAHLQRTGADGVSPKFILQYGPAATRSAAARDAAISLLKKHHYVKEAQGKRNTMSIVLNPALLRAGADG